MDHFESLKVVFDEHFSHVKFDNKLAREVYQYQIGYVNSSREYLEFFGSNLLGVHVIRFKDSDVFRLFDDVFDVDYYELESDIREVKTINHEFKISSDLLNLTLMYILHRFMTESTMNDSSRKRACYDTALIFFYRCVAALMSHYFKYPADPKIAQAAYSKLSNKFLIKKLGSWHRVMDYRAEDLIDRRAGIHVKHLQSFTDDARIVYAINDSQSRVKDLIKGYYAEFIKVHSEGENVAVTKGTYMDADGEETVKEKTKSVENYVTYMQQAMADQHTFIKDDLISIITQINSNTSFRTVKATLLWLHEKQNDPKYSKLIGEFVGDVVVQSLYLIKNNMTPKNMRDYQHILPNLKNLYLSTRTVDKDIERIRDVGFKLIKEANKKVSPSLILATRTSIILYITLRALVGQTTS